MLRALTNGVVLVPVALAAQAILVTVAAGTERPPQMANLASFPASVGDWKMTSELAIAPDVQQTLGADRLLSRVRRRMLRGYLIGRE